MSRQILVLLALVGCGSGSFGDGVSCQGQRCPNGTICCLQAGQQPGCAASCPAMGLSVACDGPDDCDPGGARFCCQQYSLSPEPGLTCMSSPNLIVSGTAACASSCYRVHPPDASACGASGTDRLCGTSADCAGNTGNTNCCSSSDGVWWSVCVDDATRSSILANNGSCS
jgi:hypothetical protein